MRVLWPVLALLTGASCAAPGVAAALAAQRQQELAAAPAAWIGICYEDLVSGDRVELDAEAVVHAASTMKVAVLIELFRQAGQGRIDLDGALWLRNRFASLVDGSPYELAAADDSDPELYARAGTLVPVRELATRMIVRSSNLATNLLLERLTPARVQAAIESLGTRRMQVLRGLEDGKAFRAGRNNVTCAADLALLLSSIARGQAASRPHCEQMLAILRGQQFRDMIPAGLPPGTPVAHKTGTITRVHHDAAVVYEQGRPAWVLVVLTRGYERQADSARAGAALARRADAAR